MGFDMQDVCKPVESNTSLLPEASQMATFGKWNLVSEVLRNVVCFPND